MSVIAEFSVDSSDFVLGRALKDVEDASIEFEKVIPTGSASIPYFWVLGDETGAFDEALSQEPEPQEFEVVDQLDGRRLYRATWDASADTFLEAISSHDLVLLEATGDAESWDFKFRFPGSHDLSAFHTEIREAGLDFSVTRLFNPIEPTLKENWGLTAPQRGLLESAYDAGYFEVPRQTTLVEMAEDLGISDQSVNERLRRGIAALVETTLKKADSSSD